ncbi:hypothetical protein K432DRAFT_401123 [Lepidopterella palustris CBS 459.81]|uniref:Uncharacterized protein n=1 Tax=Lepidopterella palustris CBS 459.81 TaxID=1314670 RepID=A0A8E2JIZ6_9PEZI|nr:hypothetical protein K432DRAFT_401123 [Lepidopterella palustris CBS 459.81]
MFDRNNAGLEVKNMFRVRMSLLIALHVACYIFQAVAEDVKVRPSSGEQILANVTYTMQWNLTGYPPCGGITFSIPWMTPPFTSYLTVDSPWYETMTSTGYQTIVFTEINPTSTTTMITVGYWNAGFLDAPIPGAPPFTMGPFTVMSHAVSLPPLTTPPPTPPPTAAATSGETKTEYVTIYTATYVSTAALPTAYVPTYSTLVVGISVGISTFIHIILCTSYVG